MVAPAYAEQRRGLAQAIGLGRKKVTDVTAPVVKTVKKAAESAVAAVEGVTAPAPKKRGRPAKVPPQAVAAPAADEKTEA